MILKWVTKRNQFEAKTPILMAYTRVGFKEGKLMPDNNETEDGSVQEVAAEVSTNQAPEEPVQLQPESASLATGPTYEIAAGPTGPQGAFDPEIYYQNMRTTPSGTLYVGPTGPPSPHGFTVPLGPLGSQPGRGGYVNPESDLRKSEDWSDYEKEPLGSGKKRELAKKLEDKAASQAKEANRIIAAKHVTPALEDLVLHGDLDSSLLSEKEIEAFVLSIDIRRSTELMLKTTNPLYFANFLLTLSKYLKETVFLYNGIFEKFTGDGILACFPKKFSGEHAGFYAICAAQESHQEFAGYYRKYRNIFKSVLLDVGLGIGIDYGKISMAYANDTLTIVGEPVVYACRMSGAPAGMTYLNQQAYVEILGHKQSKSLCIKEAEINIKHERSLRAYSVVLNNLKADDLDKPQWENLIKPRTAPNWT
jgi:class 3 adenylate cyclase